jgi:hypothetical protein
MPLFDTIHETHHAGRAADTEQPEEFCAIGDVLPNRDMPLFR